MTSRFNTAFSSTRFNGLDNVPKNGALIFAPNHTNALMDALTVLMITRRASVFVAKAGLFKKPVIARIMRFFKIMPIMRARDGLKSVEQNRAIIAQSVKVLETNTPFVIFAEGTDRMMHSLLPLGKGVFRIALGVNQDMQGRMPVYIVPVGIEYGNYKRYHSTLSVQVGRPINITKFCNEHPNLEEQELMSLLRPELSNRIKELIHYLPDDNFYPAARDICYLLNNHVKKELAMKADPTSTMLANRHTAQRIENLKEQSPELAQSLLQKVATFAALREQLDIADETIYDALDRKHNNAVYNALAIATLFVALPYLLVCCAIDWPYLLTAWLITRKLDDEGLKNSIRFGLDMIIGLIIYILLFTLLLAFTKWYIAIIGLSLALPATPVLHSVAKRIRLMRSGQRFFKNVELQAQLSDIRKTLIQIGWLK